jgi:hypothetical protein
MPGERRVAMLAKNFPAMSLAQVDAALTLPGSPFEIEERNIRGVQPRVEESPPSMRGLFLLARARGERTFVVFVVYRDERANYEVSTPFLLPLPTHRLGS